MNDRAKITKRKIRNVKARRDIKRSRARKIAALIKSSDRRGQRQLTLQDTLFKYGFMAQDATYNAIRDNKQSQDKESKLFAIKLWHQFERYADSKFKTQLRYDFHAGYWEMYLANALMEMGYLIDSADSGPDIKIEGQPKVWIEAVTSKDGESTKPPDIKPISSGKSEFINISEDEIMLRYTSSINEKFRKGKGYIEKGVMSEDDAYIIAINGASVSHSRSDDVPPWVFKTLFGVGPQTITVYPSSSKSSESNFSFMPSIVNKNKAIVPTTYFQAHHYKELSGVLFSLTNVSNRPFAIGADFIFIHNPFAKVQVPGGFFKRGKEYIAAHSADGKQFNVKIIDWESSAQ